jgi:hypothetical protein
VSVESRRRLDLHWVLVLLLAVFAVAPLTYPGFFEAQSGFLPSLNVEHLSEAPNFARARDLVRGEGKLPYLLAFPAFQGSGNGIVAIKWGYGLAFFLGALGVYAWTRHWLGARGAVLAAVIYTYLPWHLGTVYVRGAYAEAWLWAFWPVILWAIDRWFDGRLLVAAVVGLSAVIAAMVTQPGLFTLSVPLLVAYGVGVNARRPWPAWQLVGALALPLLLLWFAARAVPPSQPAFSESFLVPFQLLTAAWGDGPSFQLGLAGVGLSIVGLALWLSQRSTEPVELGGTAETGPDNPAPSAPLGRAPAFWALSLLVLTLLTLPLAGPLWALSGFDAFLTYPWQLLALTGLPLAFLAGSVVRLDLRLATLPAWAGLLALVVLASYHYLGPDFTQVDPGPEPAAMFRPAEADAPELMLLDHEIAPPTEITATLTLTLTWQAVQPVAGDYTVFVHVLAGEEKVAQQDTRPCDGECPTSAWQPGQIISDRYQLALPREAPPGPYRLAVGLYLLDTGERAAVVGRDDRTVYFDVP